MQERIALFPVFKHTHIHTPDHSLEVAVRQREGRVKLFGAGEAVACRAPAERSRGDQSQVQKARQHKQSLIKKLIDASTIKVCVFKPAAPLTRWCLWQSPHDTSHFPRA